MITFLKRLALLTALWLGIGATGVVYFNTRSPEQVESDARAVLEPLDQVFQSALLITTPESEPLPADDVMRAETETTLAEVEALYDELIATKKAIQTAHTDYWEKRWAGDRVTLAEMGKERARQNVERIQNPLQLFGDNATTPEAVSGRLDAARRAAERQKARAESELAIAREELHSVERALRQD